MMPPSPSVRSVLMTADTVGGVWTYALELAGALARHNVRTVLASVGPAPSDSQREVALAIPGLVLELGPFRLEWMDLAGEDVGRTGAWLGELCQRYRPDIVHLNGFAHGAWRFPAPVLVVGHSCIGTWWRAVHGSRPPARYDGYLERVRDGLHGADAVATPTRAYLDQLTHLYGPLADARVIPNGRDPDAFRPADEKREMVFSAGRVWDEAKNVIALDRIAADLDWPVVVAGDWRPPSGSAEPPANLLCLDLVEPVRLRQWFGDAAIFALPARFEPFGLAALEAALSGCALVLGDLATLREVWGTAACYVPPDDPAALRAVLQELIRDPDRRRTMAARARRRAGRYTAERMASGYLALYGDLRSGRARRGRVAEPAVMAG